MVEGGEWRANSMKAVAEDGGGEEAEGRGGRIGGEQRAKVQGAWGEAGVRAADAGIRRAERAVERPLKGGRG